VKSLASTLPLGLAVALSVLVALAAPAAARADATDACLQASDEGQNLRDQGKLNAARARFLTCSGDACPQIVRADCAGWLADVDRRLPSVVLSAEDPAGHDTAEVKVTMDGAPLADRLEARAVPVDPGEHRFHFDRAGSPAVEETVILREGEQRRAVVVRFHAIGEAPPGLHARGTAPSRGVVGAAVALGGVTLVGGGLFAYFASTAESDANHLRGTCAGCPPGAVSAVRTREIVANVSLGVGIAAVVTGVGVLVFGPREVPGTASVAMVPGGGVLRMGGRF
jgi:hypothetical protein